MDRRVLIAAVLGMLMVFSAVTSVRAGIIPPECEQLHLRVATIEGGMPETVDPAWCYDTASAELIFNVYDTLITFDGEHMETFLPSIATEWKIENITGSVSPEGLPWYYKYTFKIRTGVKFYDLSGEVDTLTPEDVEYSFERALVQDRASGPTWMFYEPLLNTWGAFGLNTSNIVPGEPGFDETELIRVGKMIDHAVESNNTHVWFNLAFPGAYTPFMQILSQSWSSILSKEWINSLGRTEWNGEWGDYTSWINYHDPEISPLDDPEQGGPVMCGTGPFILETLSYTDCYWTVVRNVHYWRGWPADFPKLGPTLPAGYVDRVTVWWKWTWETRREMFLAGQVDFCAVPRPYIGQMYLDAEKTKLKPGIRCIYPLPILAVDGIFFMFDIDPSTTYGKVNDYGVFTRDGIPRDFFGNPTWGIHVRKAFAYAFDYERFLEEVYLGEAIAPATAIIPGLPCYDPTIKGYEYNPEKALYEFSQVPGLLTTGFTITILYNTGNIPRQRAAEILSEGIEIVDELEGSTDKFTVEITSVDWRPYLRACLRHLTPLFIIGWLADYPDPHNFAYAFYYSHGAFGAWQLYENPTMDALIEEAIAEADWSKRCALYRQISLLAVEDCPSVPIDQAIGRHFERSCIVGWYYNPIYPGVYAYNIWKWFYIPHYEYSWPPTHPINNHLPYDVNYDGVVDGKDISVVARAFGSDPGPPVHPRWCYRADVNNDRVCDGKDLSYVSRNFGKESPKWSYTPPTPPEHDLKAVIVSAPEEWNVTKDGYEDVPILVQVINIGTSTETNINVQILQNGTIIQPYTISSLDPGKVWYTYFKWDIPTSPVPPVTYEIKLYVVPVAGETNIGNNEATVLIQVVK
ncbi:MAG: ABC transporter substrate-binding protein [Candidatus Bathyarchaeia archaeon]